jgi:WD repeat-containing protein 59
MQPHQGSGARGEKAFRDLEKSIPTPMSMSLPIPMASIRRGGTMSRRNLAGRSARMDAFTWLSNVKVDEKRESSGGHDGIESSRLSSRSRPPSNSEYHMQDVSRRHRSSSWSRANDDRREGDGNQSLQDECVSVF